MAFLAPKIERLKAKGRVDALVAALSHADPSIGGNAENALVELGGTRTIELCVDMFRGLRTETGRSAPSAQALSFAAEVLFRIADPSGALTRLVRDDSALRHRLLRAGKPDALSGGERAPSYLLLEAALRNAEPAARRELAATLVEDAQELDVVPPGGYGVGDWGFLVYSIDEVREAMEARRAAEEARREELRAKALNAPLPWSSDLYEILREVPVEAAKVLIAAFDADPSAIDRRTVDQWELFNTAGHSGDPEGEKAGLMGLKFLRRGSSPHMSAALSENMADISDKRSRIVSKLIASHDVEGLIAELEWLHGPMLDKVVRALGGLGDGRAPGPLITVLREAVRHEEGRDRRTADITSRALEAHGPDAAPVLVGALNEELTLVRWFAARILAKVGDEAVVPALTAARSDPDEGVREAASVALDQIEARNPK